MTSTEVIFFGENTMINALLVRKLKQTQAFSEAGVRMPVTIFEANPCWITAITDHGIRKNVELGYGTKKQCTKRELGHLKKAGLEEKKLRFLRSMRVTELSETEKIGSEVLASQVFTVGDKVSVTGVSKGKGFAGVVKRHGFSGGPRSHGQSDRERAPGSIGQTTTPGRVYKGKRMAGRMGSDTVTVRGLSVVSIDTENKRLIVKGVVPGGVNGLCIVKKESR